MADEQNVEQVSEETPVEQTEESPEKQAGESTETATTEEPGQSKEGTAETQKETVETQPPVEPPRKFKLKVDGQEEEHDEPEVIDYAQKGIHFSKNQQRLADYEQSVRQKVQSYDQMVANPLFWRIMMAQRMNIDPSVILSNPAQPSPELEQTDPRAFYQQLAAYDTATRQKQAVDQALNTYTSEAIGRDNAALFAGAKIKYDLSEPQLAEVTQFVQQKLRPNTLGMYAEQDVEIAVNALYGKERLAKEKLKVSENIQKKVQEASKKSAARGAVAQKPEVVSEEVAEARRFNQVLRERFGQK